MTIFKRTMIAISAAGLAMSLATAAYAASPWGKWKRPNGNIAKVYKCKGGMCGVIEQGKRKGFVMFNGIKKKGSAWKGDMKHPEMPGFMTFNGTVTMVGADKLKVQGCAIGNSMCDAEVWTRVK